MTTTYVVYMNKFLDIYMHISKFRRRSMVGLTINIVIATERRSNHHRFWNVLVYLL